MDMQTFLALQSILHWLTIAFAVASLGYLAYAIADWSSPKRKRRLIKSGLFLAMIPICVVAHALVLNGLVLPAMANNYTVEFDSFVDSISVVALNDEAPMFSSPLLSGKEFDLAEHRGKVVLLNFFATTCENCRKETPSLESIWKNHCDDEAFAMVALGVGEGEQELREFTRIHRLSYPIADDTNRKVFSMFADKGVPRTYLVSPNGKICFQSAGFWEDEIEALKQRVAEMLTAQQINQKIP